jgi:hypothetical protein
MWSSLYRIGVVRKEESSIAISAANRSALAQFSIQQHLLRWCSRPHRLCEAVVSMIVIQILLSAWSCWGFVWQRVS